MRDHDQNTTPEARGYHLFRRVRINDPDGNAIQLAELPAGGG
jgi:hypothetical protein